MPKEGGTPGKPAEKKDIPETASGAALQDGSVTNEKEDGSAKDEKEEELKKPEEVQ